MTQAAVDIFEVIRAGDVEAARRLVRQDPSIVKRRNDQGVSALLFARYMSKMGIVDTMMKTRPALDIFEASALGNTVRLAELIASDPELVSRYSSDGYTPLHLAAFFGQDEAAGLLLAEGASVATVSRNDLKVAPLHSSIAGGHLALSKLLIEHGADVNARQQGGWTPLHGAAQNGDRELAQFLLDKGADAEAANDEGKTPAGIARAAGHTLLAETLAGR